MAEADNEEVALELLAARSFDLVLLDYRIPGMDGIEVLHEAKWVNPGLDMVMITAQGTIEKGGCGHERMSREARDLFITYDDPVNVRELENIIERAVVVSRGPVISVGDRFFQQAASRDGAHHGEANGSLQLPPA